MKKDYETGSRTRRHTKKDYETGSRTRRHTKKDYETGSRTRRQEVGQCSKQKESSNCTMLTKRQLSV